MGLHGALSSADFEPSTCSTLRQEQIQQALLSIALHKTGAKLGEDRLIKARGAQLQAEEILPIQAAADGICGLHLSSTFTSDDAVISSNIIPYGLMRK